VHRIRNCCLHSCLRFTTEQCGGNKSQRVGGADRPRSPALIAVLGAICALAKDVLELWYVRLGIRVGGRAAELRTLALVAVLGANHALAKDALQL